MAAPAKSHGSAHPRPEWIKARRIVVKIGSSLLVDRANGELKSAWLATLADDVAALVAAGRQVIIVSSGAIALAIAHGLRWLFDAYVNQRAAMYQKEIWDKGLLDDY
jgi:hypothetical protein